MQSPFRDRAVALLRLVVLQVLDAAAKEGVPDINDSILRSSVAEFGPAPNVEMLREVVDWLHGQGLLTVRAVGSYRVVAITHLGADVTAGAVTIDGVRRPD